MTALGFMAQHGDRLIDNGWPIIPIMPGTKAPGELKRGRWEPMPGWQRFCERPTKALEVDIWRRWPGCAVGIACGTVVGIDIDITDAASATAVERLARARFGETPLLRIGQAPKRLLVYRAAEPFPSIQRANIQILARGRQFLAYAIHPVTARPYEWPDESPLDVDLASVPAVTFASVQAFLEEAVAALPEELRVSRMPVAPTAVSGKGQRGTVPAVAAALEWIPNDDWHYDDWIGIGLAIKGALGEDGRDLWLSWSAKAPKDDPAVTARKWDREMRAPKAGAGTIYWMAERYGWVADPHLILNGDEADLAMQPNPAQALIDRIKSSPPVAAVGDRPRATAAPIPPALFDVDGVLKMLVDRIVASSIRPQPFLALGAAVCAVGVLAGRRYRTETDLRTNLYVAAVADSGSGKDHAPECIRQAFSDAGLDRYLGGEGIASGAGLLSSLQVHPSRLFVVDELGLFLAGVTGKRVPPHRAEIWAELLRLYSRAKGTYRGAEYADQRAKARVDLQQPNACFYGTTTPSTFWSALEGGAMLDGSLARFLVFLTDQNYPPRNRQHQIWQTGEDLVAALTAIADGARGHDHGGNIATLMTATAPIVPYTVHMEPAARQELDQRLDDQDHWAIQVEGTPKSAIVNRIGENAAKLALIRAISRDPAAPAITRADVAWGWALSEHCAQTLLREADRFISENETEARHKKVLAIIRRSGVKGITQNELTRDTQYLTNRDRGEVIAALVEAGLILREAVKAEGPGRPSTRFWAAEIVNSINEPSSDGGSATH